MSVFGNIDGQNEMRDELLLALRNLEISANTVSYCYDKRPENFARSLRSLQDDAEHARTLIAKYEISHE